MNYGPLIFLAAFFALAGSWFGFVVTPQAQIGRLQQTNTLRSPDLYPLARPGLAREGLAVYRANGCADCHSQQLRQTGALLVVTLTEAGTNPPAVGAALRKLKEGLTEAEAKQWLGALPKDILSGINRPAANAAVKALSDAGAKAALSIVPVGPDLARGWGRRRTVARDFIFDSPTLLGSQRIGPDLADVGARRPDANWQLAHLYNPRAEVAGSPMPAYRFLFEQRRVQRAPSPDALPVSPGLAPSPGCEIVPKPEAKALVAYLLSLRVDAPLFEAPMATPASPASTNAPATNAAPAATVHALPPDPAAQNLENVENRRTGLSARSSQDWPSLPLSLGERAGVRASQVSLTFHGIRRSDRQGRLWGLSPRAALQPLGPG